MAKLKVFLRIPVAADCGVGYYRQYLPLLEAKKQGALNFVCHKFTWGEDVEEDQELEKLEAKLNEGGKYADIMYFSRNDVPGYIAQAGGMRDFFQKPIVLDIDDNVQATRPYNPGYRSFHPGSPNMVWNIKSLGVFDAFIVSTQNLKDYYSKYTDPSNIYVCPNSLDWEERNKVYDGDFSKSKIFPKKNGEIRIGWSGSAAHWENLKQIEDAIVQILIDYPQTTFYYSGLFADLFQDKEIKDRVHRVPWSKLKNWAYANREMNFDIALAPLCDNDFNRAKSNLRVLEYASARYSVIASPVEPYNCFNNKEVIFATEPEEWYNAMEKLIKNKELREKLALTLYNKCKSVYNISSNYKYWVKALEDINKKFKKKLKK